MARSRNKPNKEYSSMSDEALAALLAADYERAPYEFASEHANDAVKTDDVLPNTSARGIEPMKKWL